MLDPFKKALDLLEPTPAVSGEDKVMTLPAAMERFIRPGMTLHLCTTHNRAGAIVMELTRAFRGQDPGFTFSCIGCVSSHIQAMVELLFAERSNGMSKNVLRGGLRQPVQKTLTVLPSFLAAPL